MRHLIALPLALSLVACAPEDSSTESPTPTLDQGVDLGVDARLDAAHLPLDVGSDEDITPVDLGADEGVDEGTDAALDLGNVEETSVADATPDLGPPPTACGDGVDNDEDGLVDLDDPACLDETGEDEADRCGPSHEARNISWLARVEGTTEGAPAVMNACRQNQAPEVAFLFTLDRPVASLRLSTAGSAFDTLLSVRRDCADETTELACDDDAEAHAPARTSEVTLLDPAPGHYAIILDGFLEERGPYVLTIRAALPPGAPCPEADAPPALTCPDGHLCREGACAVAACADGLDNDEDGRVDWPADPGCAAPESDDEVDPASPPACADGLDNDGDGLVDWPEDPHCAAASDDQEQAPPACADGVDNDGDGRVDLADSGCDGPEDEDEYTREACRDGRDNDGDDRRDYPEDPGCASPLDEDEADPTPPPECADGVDNDEDGLTDWPEDAESCLFAASPIEGDPCAAAPLDVTGLPLARGTLEGRINQFQSTCAPNSGPDLHLIWRAAPDRPLARLILDARASRSGVSLYARRGCGAAEVACGPYFEVFDAGPVPGGEALDLFIDALTAQSVGLWQAQITAQVAIGGRCDGGPPWTCALGAACVEEGDAAFCRRAACGDELDNDGDGFIDFPFDPGCLSLDDADETTPSILPACADGVDNDGDGLRDFGEDPRCVAAADPAEGPECSDGVDNDGDGLIDFVGDEPGCACPEDELESPQPACDDRCDNDGDGLIDLIDPGCRGDPDGVSEAHLAECADGIDNDGDGRVDFPQDPSCRFSHDPLEEPLAAPPECADGLDNDEDGLIDEADPNCDAAASPWEAGACAAPPPAAPVGLFEADTFGAPSLHASGCLDGAGGASAPERAYTVEIPYPAMVQARLNAQFNALLYARSSCAPLDESGASTELACAAVGLSGALDFAWSGGSWVIFIDAINAVEGRFTLEVEGIYPEGARCGPALSAHARCDDGLICRPSEGDPTCQRSR